MYKAGDSMVSQANGIYMDLKIVRVSLRPTSSNSVKNYLHQVILWHSIQKGPKL